jgi:hypothetical protein
MNMGMVLYFYAIHGKQTATTPARTTFATAKRGMVPSFVASGKYTIKRGGKTCDDFVTGSVAGRKTALIRAQLGNITNSQSRITWQASCYTKCIVTILEFLLPGPHLE